LPRSKKDHKWDRLCVVCGATFWARKDSHTICSVKCRATLPNAGQTGFKPSAGLAPKPCEVCGEEFQPYRASQRVCNWRCDRVLNRERDNARNRLSPLARPPKPLLEKKACAGCGTAFRPIRSNHKYCSASCKEKAYHPGTNPVPAKALAIELLCAVCDAKFVPVRGNQKYCSPNCRRAQELRDIKTRARYQKQNYLYKYKLTPEQVEAKVAAQGGVCMICKKPPNPEGKHNTSILHVDHDHETGTIRDMLCGSCNKSLGGFQDSPELLRAAADYIECHQAVGALSPYTGGTESLKEEPHD
jgi:predicted nucleic acid-binding Zn ribbon protein